MNRPRTDPPTGRLGPVLVVAVTVVLVLMVTAGTRSYRDLDAARQREALLETRIEETRARVEALKARIYRLRHDPRALERLAREELGMVRPEDVVIVLPER